MFSAFACNPKFTYLQSHWTHWDLLLVNVFRIAVQASFLCRALNQKKMFGVIKHFLPGDKGWPLPLFHFLQGARAPAKHYWAGHSLTDNWSGGCPWAEREWKDPSLHPCGGAWAGSGWPWSWEGKQSLSQAEKSWAALQWPLTRYCIAGEEPWLARWSCWACSNNKHWRHWCQHVLRHTCLQPQWLAGEGSCISRIKAFVPWIPLDMNTGLSWNAHLCFLWEQGCAPLWLMISPVNMKEEINAKNTF